MLIRTDLSRTVLPAEFSQFEPQLWIRFLNLSMMGDHWIALVPFLKIGAPR